MDIVLDYFSDSVTPSSPASISTPNFIRESRSLGDTSTVDKKNSLIIPEPLTPLETKLKDIILNVYCDTPATVSSDLVADSKPSTSVHTVNEPEINRYSSTQSLKEPSLEPSLPKHIVSSKMSFQSLPSESFINPIFSADDSPASPMGVSMTDSAHSSLPPAPMSGIRNSVSTDSQTALFNSVNYLPLSPNDAFSPDDLPHEPPLSPLKLNPLFHPLPSNMIAEKRLPGYIQRVSNEETLKSEIPPSSINDRSASPRTRVTPEPLSIINSSTGIRATPEPPQHIKPSKFHASAIPIWLDKTGSPPKLSTSDPGLDKSSSNSSNVKESLDTDIRSLSATPVDMNTERDGQVRPTLLPITTTQINNPQTRPSLPPITTSSVSTPQVRPSLPTTSSISITSSPLLRPTITPITTPRPQISTTPAKPSFVHKPLPIALPLSTDPVHTTSTELNKSSSNHSSVEESTDSHVLPSPVTPINLNTERDSQVRPPTLGPITTTQISDSRSVQVRPMLPLIATPRSQISTTPAKPPFVHKPLPVAAPVSTESIRSTSSNGNDGPETEDLQKKIKQLLKEKVNLEGQLESMVNECQLALHDRAQLQMQLTKTKSKFETSGDLQQVATAQGMQQRASSDADRSRVEQLEADLLRKRQELGAVNSENRKLKQQLEEIQKQLISSRQYEETANIKLRESNSESMALKAENDEKSSSIDVLSDQVAKLQASLESTESAKKWSHDQLQEAIQSKAKLQQELRGLKASQYSNTAKADQLEQENNLLNKQLKKLQGKMLQDKANLVSNLEEVEADVLLRETLFAEMEDKQNQLEEVVQLKNEQMEKMRSQLEKDQGETTALELKLADLNSSSELLTAQIRSLEGERVVLNQELQLQKAAVERKDAEIESLKKDKTSQQQELKQLNAKLIAKEGQIQGLKDSGEIKRQEMQAVSTALEETDTELSGIRKQMTEKEAQITEHEMKIRQLSSELAFVKQKLLTKEESLLSTKSLLMEKVEEVEGKNSEIVSLGSRVSTLMAEIESLHSQLNLAIKEADIGKERTGSTMAHLQSENDEMRKELNSTKSDCARLQSSLRDAEIENKHLKNQLESMVDASPTVDEIKRIVDEKTDLEVELTRCKVKHAQEMSKLQAKETAMSEEIDALRQECGDAETLREEIEALKLETLKNRSTTPLVETEKSKAEIKSLQSLLKLKDSKLDDALQREEVLDGQVLDLKEQLREEHDRSSDLEQANRHLELQVSELEATVGKEEEMAREIHDLVVDNEKLKGRLAGTDRAQACLREHIRLMENSVADKEAKVSKQLAENSSILSQKEIEIETLESKISNLQDRINSLKAEVEKSLTERLFDQQKCEDLERALQEKEDLLSRKEDEKERKLFEETIADLEQQNITLKGEIGTLKQKLDVLNSSYEYTKRELNEKTSMAEILDKKTELLKAELLQAQEELTAVEDRFGVAELRHRLEIEALQNRLTGSQLLSEKAHDEDVASFGSFEDSVVDHLKDQDSLQRAQLEELQGRLVKARREGEELAERKVIGEMKSLRSQLGVKSKALRTLQDCVSSLRDEMSAVQLYMESPTLKQSYNSSREIEEKIEDLHQI